MRYFVLADHRHYLGYSNRWNSPFCQNVRCLPRYSSYHPVAHFGTSTFNGVNTSNGNLGWSFSLTTLYQSSCRFYNGRSRRLPLTDCKTIDDVLQLAVDNLDNLPPDQLAAVWTFILRLLPKNPRSTDLGQYKKDYAAQKAEANQFELKIYKLLERTMNALESMKPKDLTTIVLGLAKIVQNIQKAKEKRRVNTNQKVFGNVLVDGKSNPKRIIFNDLAAASNSKLHRFDPRYLSNLAYAYALLGYDPVFDDGTTLLENVAGESVESMRVFNSHDISNLVWAYATLKVSHPVLFQSVGDAVTLMPNLNEFKPQALSNTVCECLRKLEMLW